MGDTYPNGVSIQELLSYRYMNLAFSWFCLKDMNICYCCRGRKYCSTHYSKQ